MKYMNKTFEDFESFKSYAQPYGNLYFNLKNINSYEDQSKILTELFASKFYKELSVSNIPDKFGFDFNTMIDRNVTDTFNRVKENLNLLETTNLITRYKHLLLNNITFKRMHNFVLGPCPVFQQTEFFQ